jgi:Glycosyl hydrolases family 32 C terminal
MFRAAAQCAMLTPYNDCLPSITWQCCTSSMCDSPTWRSDCRSCCHLDNNSHIDAGPRHLQAVVNACRGDAAYSGVIVHTDDTQHSLVVAINWATDELLWLKAPPKDVHTDSPHGFAALRSNATGTVLSEGNGTAALTASLQAFEGAQEDIMHLRVLLDGSAVEVFTGTGQVASTRVYANDGGKRSLAVLSLGGSTQFDGSAWRMGSIWV